MFLYDDLNDYFISILAFNDYYSKLAGIQLEFVTSHSSKPLLTLGSFYQTGVRGPFHCSSAREGIFVGLISNSR